MKITLAVLTLLFVFFLNHNIAHALPVFEGQVINVVPDEEGTNVMMKAKDGTFKSVYIPRSNANVDITQKAIDAYRTKRNFKFTK